VLVDELDQLPEPRAGDRHVSRGKRQGQPLRRFRVLSARIGFERVVAELRDGEARLRSRIRPQLDKIESVPKSVLSETRLSFDIHGEGLRSE
jgi:hypothetical protein